MTQVKKQRTIKRRIGYEDLTSTAKSELPEIVEEIINENTERFVNFYNNARPLSLKHHQLELLPKVGKKQMLKILEEREIEPFSTFEDVNKRVKGLPDAKRLILDRVLEEIEGDPDHIHFVPEFGRS